MRPPAECFISRKTRARQCFYYFKEFPENALIKTCSLVHCNLNGANLFIFVSYNYTRAYTSWCFLIAKLASHWIVFSLACKMPQKNRKLKHSRMELFTVSGMLIHSRWCCLQRGERSMHNCTLFSLEVS